MSTGVQFEEDNFSFKSSSHPVNNRPQGTSLGYGHPQYEAPESKGMGGWLVRHGLAKTGNTAQVILVGVVIINIIITYVVVTYFL